MGQMAQRVVGEARQRDLLAPRRQPAEHRVHQTGGALGSDRPGTAHALVDGCGCRDAVGEDDLVGAQAQQRGHARLELRELAVEHEAQEVVQAAAEAQRAVDQLGGQRPVRRRQRALAQGRVEGEIGEGARALHAGQHAQGQQPRLGGRRCVARHGPAAGPSAPQPRAPGPLHSAAPPVRAHAGRPVVRAGGVAAQVRALGEPATALEVVHRQRAAAGALEHAGHEPALSRGDPQAAVAAHAHGAGDGVHRARDGACAQDPQRLSVDGAEGARPRGQGAHAPGEARGGLAPVEPRVVAAQLGCEGGPRVVLRRPGDGPVGDPGSTSTIACAARSASRAASSPAVSSVPMGVRTTCATGPASISRSTRMTDTPVSASPARMAWAMGAAPR